MRPAGRGRLEAPSAPNSEQQEVPNAEHVGQQDTHNAENISRQEEVRNGENTVQGEKKMNVRLSSLWDEEKLTWC